MMQELLSRTRNALRKLWSLLVYIAREIWAGFRGAPRWKQLAAPLILLIFVGLLVLPMCHRWW